MSEEIHWLLEVEILPGKLDEFESVARDLIASTQPEPGTVNYEWYFNADKTACHIYERYANNAALITHVNGFGKFAERFMQACRPTRFNVYGMINEEAKAHLADLHPVYFSVLGEISR
jgi:quinol monooxygenase YgiN